MVVKKERKKGFLLADVWLTGQLRPVPLERQGERERETEEVHDCLYGEAPC